MNFTLICPSYSEKASAVASPVATMANTPLSMGTAASTATPGTPRGAEAAEEFFGGGMRWQEAHGGIIGAAVQNLRARSIKRKSGREATKSPSSPGARASAPIAAAAAVAEHIYEEPTSAAATVAATRVKFKDEQETEHEKEHKEKREQEKQEQQEDECSVTLRRSVATSTPALVVRIEREPDEEQQPAVGEVQQPLPSIEMAEHQRQLALPLKPPRRKSSRSNSPSIVYAPADEESMLRARETVSTCSSRQTRN